VYGGLGTHEHFGVTGTSQYTWLPPWLGHSPMGQPSRFHRDLASLATAQDICCGFGVFYEVAQFDRAARKMFHGGSIVKALRILVLGLTVSGMNAESLIQSVPERKRQKNKTHSRAMGRPNVLEPNCILGSALPAMELTEKDEAKAPPLVGQEIHDARSGALFWVLKHGSLRRGMPSFAHLPEARRWQIVTFLKAESK